MRVGRRKVWGGAANVCVALYPRATAIGDVVASLEPGGVDLGLASRLVTHTTLELNDMSKRLSSVSEWSKTRLSPRSRDGGTAYGPGLNTSHPIMKGEKKDDHE